MALGETYSANHTSLIYTLNAGFLNRLEKTADFEKKNHPSLSSGWFFLH